MIRADTGSASPHVMLIVSAARGLAMQYRATPGGATANVAIVPGAAPAWVRLRRDGGQVVGETSGDGINWSEVGRIAVALPDYPSAGLVVTSHDNAALATAVFDDIVVER